MLLSQFRDTRFTSLFGLLMGLYMLNISVDSTDLNPRHVPEDLTINDQESLIEILLEQVLGIEDAVKEYDDNDSDNSKKRVQTIDLANPHSTFDNTLEVLRFAARLAGFFDGNGHLSQGFCALDFPPPKI